MFEIKSYCDESLAPLAWIASLEKGRETAVVQRGALVEEGDRFVCEAAWAGDFATGDFDRTPLIFGSGLRSREKGVYIVSSGTTVDRLWVWRSDSGRRLLVSNSLVEVLGSSGAELLENYRDYERDLESIVGGLNAYEEQIPVKMGKLSVVYFYNLVWNGAQLSSVRKPAIENRFHSFASYWGFLNDTAQAMARNVTADDRGHSVRLLTTISAGYDSPAASIVAREMGCTDAVTIRQARSLVPRSDSGRHIGERLGLEVTEYDRDNAIGASELRFWAAMGKPQDINLGIFDYPDPVCLFLTGFHGDKVWTTDEHDTTDQIVRGDTTGLGFTEERLHRGVLHCPVPFWGVRRMEEIVQISRSREMKPWRLENDYDRPIPRRIVESAGIPRDAFGQRKSATSSNWRDFPYTPELLHDFFEYADAHGGDVSPIVVKRLQSTADDYLNAVKAKCPVVAKYIPSMAPDIPAIHLQWAVDRLLSRRCS